MLESAAVAVEKPGHALVKAKAQENPPAVRQDQHEADQPPLGATDLDLAEMRPVDLPLLARQRAQADVRLGGLARPVL